MKPSLQLKIGQHLTMTPQLQQAIRLLQLSSLDLQQEIQQALYDNPLLELAEEEEHKKAQQEQSTESNEQQSNNSQAEQSTDSEVAADGDWDNKIPDDLPVDASWDDLYETASIASPTRQTNSSGESRDFDSFQAVSDSLQDHLLWQLNLTPMSDSDRIVAAAIIDAIGDDGFLNLPIEDIWQGLVDSNQPQDQPEEEQLELDEVMAVLRRIQNFDPVGVGATSLSDCLLIQLRQLPDDTPWLAEAMTLAESHLELVASRDSKQLQKHTGFCADTLAAAIELIQALSPRPGDLVCSNQVQ
ncbi:MAG: RNA polymerase factor sigma-54, partial [Porticoccaceae bacterium]|nr:RNA polymerase factor sigma-54 [Porticoccaceae bacterium]